MLLVGGGGGSPVYGGNGGAGSGYVAYGTFSVNNGLNVSVTVGAGGVVTNGYVGTYAGFRFVSTSFSMLQPLYQSTDNSCFSATSNFMQVAIQRSAHFCRRREAAFLSTATRFKEEMEDRVAEPL